MGVKKLNASLQNKNAGFALVLKQGVKGPFIVSWWRVEDEPLIEQC